MSTIDQQIESQIQSFVRQLSALVRAAAVESVQRALGGSGVHAQSRAAKPRAPRGAGPGGKRSPAQIQASVDTVLKFIKANPGVRSDVVRAKLKLARPTVQDAINRLKAAKKIKMTGVKRAATYR